MDTRIDRFSWRTYDVNTLLPAGWRQEVLHVAQCHARDSVLLPRSVTSREGNPNLELPVAGVNSQQVRSLLPWLYESYTGLFRDLAQQSSSEPLVCAEGVEHSIVLNVQYGSAMRYEAHVDSNPLEGLLYATDLPHGAGGELVVANRPEANSVAEIDSDCTVIYPVTGHLLLFDGRRWPHYVRPLTERCPLRVVAAMNFYTPSCPETHRPPDLTPHVRGYDVATIAHARRAAKQHAETGVPS